MKLSSLIAAVPFAFVACSPATEGEGEGEGEPVEAVCTEGEDVRCRDQSFQQLAMADVANTRAIEDTVVGDHHEVHVDATAGGFQGSEGWVYGKFTADGFVKVDLLDDAAFDSIDWDIAFRRFVVRLNSGVGGPSCVGGANLGANTGFDDVSDVPDDTEFAEETYFDDTCTLIPDGSGLPTSPGTLTQNYWKYSNQQCLQMTKNVYLVQQADGHVNAVEFTGYYNVDEQESCDSTGATLSASPGSGNIRFKWKQVL